MQKNPASYCRIITIYFVLALILFCGNVYAGGGPRNIAVIINSQSEESVEIGMYYKNARNIPNRNICFINTSTNETISSQDCETSILEPVRNWLYNVESQGARIDYLVTTKGMPLKVDYGHSTGPHSLASIMVSIKHPDIQQYRGCPYGPFAQSSWGVPQPLVAWSHSLSFNGYHFYLVTRLDGFTVEDVKRMIDRGLEPASDGKFILDRNHLTTGLYGSANNRLGTNTGSAYQILTTDGYAVSFDNNQGFISNQSDVMGYFSWSAHDNYYTYEKYISNEFKPGAIGDTYYSVSASTFNKTSTSGTPLIGELIAKGITGAGGYVSEPMISAATLPNLLFDRYTSGYNLAESFYAAMPYIFWKTVVIGDPLVAPYAEKPSVQLNIPISNISGVVNIEAIAEHSSGIAMVEFYLDDDLIDVKYNPPYILQFDSTQYPIGIHVLEAIAYENSNLLTQGSASSPINVTNVVSTVTNIAQAKNYEQGQLVRIKDKIVTAGTDELGNCFYISESDRTNAIACYTSQTVQKGNIVDVTGAVSNVAGQRVLVDVSINITGQSEVIPKPLFMVLDNLGGSPKNQYESKIGSNGGARNTGLLVRVAGRVENLSQDKKSFWLNDGSKESVAAYSNIPCNVQDGDFVAFNAISSSWTVDSQNKPLLLICDHSNFQIVSE
ncbi:MAG: TIGR03790 family protein [Armatimonadota bacterium]